MSSQPPRIGEGWIERANPARPAEIVGAVRVTTPHQVDDIVRAAAVAQPTWANEAPADRAATLLAVVDEVASEDNLTLWSETLCRELGKPLAEARGEIGFSLAALRWFAERAPSELADAETDDELGRLVLRRRPYGVVAAITPWNAPVILSMLKIAPALLAGNAVVVKPSPLAPLAVDALLEALGAALPDGLLACVQGAAETGAALVGHPGVHKVAFTGGNVVGRAIAAAAADQLTSTVLELGGNDAAIFLPDAELSPAAVSRAVSASFTTAGQVCMAAKRLYVHSSRIDAFVDDYVSIAGQTLVMGDPMTAGTTVGPVVTEQAQQRLLALLEESVGHGAAAYSLGQIADPALVAGGWFVRPTLVVGLDDDAPLVCDEQFGPLVPVQPYDSVQEVIDRANASDLGLGASVWSADEDAAFDVARQLDVGFTFINTHNRTGMALRAPFGGVKRSGYGREYGLEGLLEYVQTCSINAPAGFRPGAQPPDGPASDGPADSTNSPYPTA